MFPRTSEAYPSLPASFANEPSSVFCLLMIAMRQILAAMLRLIGNVSALVTDVASQPRVGPIPPVVAHV